MLQNHNKHEQTILIVPNEKEGKIILLNLIKFHRTSNILQH